MYPSAVNGKETDRSARTFTTTMMVIGVVLFLAASYHSIGFTWDDPFISFRYARNLAEGHGLVYNIGEKVEGYSNPLYVFICALIYRIGLGRGDLGLLYFAKIFGLACALGSVAVVWFYIRKWEYFSHLGYLPLVLFAPWILLTNIFFAGWSMGGMETVLFPFLVMLASYLLMLEVQRGKPLHRIMSWPAFIFWLAVLTRPEGPIFWFAGLVTIISLRGKYKLDRSFILSFILTFIVLMALFLAHRLWYFGDLLPNTYYAKATGGYGQLLKGLTNFTEHRAFAYIGNIIPVVLIFLPLCYPRIRDTFAYRLILFQVVIYFIFLLASGRDWMGGYRFFVHILPLLATGASFGIYALFSRDKGFYPEGGEKPPCHRAWLILISLLVLFPPVMLTLLFKINKPEGYSLYLDWAPFYSGIAFLVAVSVLELWREKVAASAHSERSHKQRATLMVLIILLLFSLQGAGVNADEREASFLSQQVFEFQSGFSRWPPVMMIEKYHVVGKWMRERLEPNGLVALGEAGAIPYFSNQPILDCFGLMDKTIARMPGDTFFDKSDSEEAADYILGREPRYFLFKGKFLPGRGWIKPSWYQFYYIQHVWDHPEFNEHYSLIYLYGDFIIYERVD